MSSSTPLLKVENVAKDYAATEGARPVPVLRAINFELACGTSAAIVGPSGCGKARC